MTQTHSFTPEEGSQVKQFIISYLSDNPVATYFQIHGAASEKFPHIDCASAVFHVLADMVIKKEINSACELACDE